MKNLFIYLFIYLFVNSCNAQSNIYNIKNSDVIIFNDGNIEEWDYINFTILTTYKHKKIFILLQNLPNDIASRATFEKSFFFSNKTDTMYIKCKCLRGYNYYFKNLEFRKGNYELSFDFGKEYNKQIKKYEPIEPTIYGYQIKTQKEVQNILFKNSYDPNEEPEQKDRYFKDVMFYKIDLKDTLHVKLQKID